MSTDNRTGVLHFCCDEPGCRANYECDEDLDFREGWAEARRAGWVNSVVRGEWRYHCPKCARELGDD